MFTRKFNVTRTQLSQHENTDSNNNNNSNNRRNYIDKQQSLHVFNDNRRHRVHQKDHHYHRLHNSLGGYFRNNLLISNQHQRQLSRDFFETPLTVARKNNANDNSNSERAFIFSSFVDANNNNQATTIDSQRATTSYAPALGCERSLTEQEYLIQQQQLSSALYSTIRLNPFVDWNNVDRRFSRPTRLSSVVATGRWSVAAATATAAGVPRLPLQLPPHTTASGRGAAAASTTLAAGQATSLTTLAASAGQQRYWGATGHSSSLLWSLGGGATGAAASTLLQHQPPNQYQQQREVQFRLLLPKDFNDKHNNRNRELALLSSTSLLLQQHKQIKRQKRHNQERLEEERRHFDRRAGAGGGTHSHLLHQRIEMLDILRSLRSFLKISRVHTDGNIFRLHYSLTVIILLAFCMIISTKQYVGDPIDCIRADGIDKSIINTYCWIHTTYSIPRAFNKKVGVDVPHPGVDNTNNPSEFQHHKYYQWVSFVLFVQAALFYVPRYLWKLWEAGKVEALVMHLDVGVGFEPDLTLKKQAIVDYLARSSGHHDWYAARYYFCECLSFANVVAQMFLLDAFFEGEFMRYGLNVLEFSQLDQEERIDPMIKIFPRVTKCKFYKYGPSANIETIDALCLLPLNIINEKIYIFLWFWFILMAMLTFVMLIFGLVVIACPPVRVYMLNLRFRMSQLHQLNIIVRKSTIGDWFLLYLLGKNMDSYIFKDVISELATKCMTKGKESDQMRV